MGPTCAYETFTPYYAAGTTYITYINYGHNRRDRDHDHDHHAGDHDHDNHHDQPRNPRDYANRDAVTTVPATTLQQARPVHQTIIANTTGETVIAKPATALAKLPPAPVAQTGGAPIINDGHNRPPRLVKINAPAPTSVAVQPVTVVPVAAAPVVTPPKPVDDLSNIVPKSVAAPTAPDNTAPKPTPVAPIVHPVIGRPLTPRPITPTVVETPPPVVDAPVVITPPVVAPVEKTPVPTPTVPEKTQPPVAVPTDPVVTSPRSIHSGVLAPHPVVTPPIMPNNGVTILPGIEQTKPIPAASTPVVIETPHVQRPIMTTPQVVPTSPAVNVTPQAAEHIEIQHNNLHSTPSQDNTSPTTAPVVNNNNPPNDGDNNNHQH